MTKKQLKAHHAKKRGFPVPPPQIHYNDKYDYRQHDRRAIEEGLADLEDDLDD
jgi:hypothetical protein